METSPARRLVVDVCALDAEDDWNDSWKVPPAHPECLLDLTRALTARRLPQEEDQEEWEKRTAESGCT